MNTHTQVAPSTIQIDSTNIRLDSEGRFCLNDLHKASGGNAKHRPNEWLRNQQAKDLVTEIELITGIPAIKTIKGHRHTGTYVVRELVYAYAMWISPKFHLQVIRAYDALQTKAQPSASTEHLPPEMPHRYRILTTIDRGQVPVQQLVPENSCIVDPNDPVAVATFIREFVPSNPQMLSAVSSAYITKFLDCQDSAIKSMQAK